MEKIKPHYLLAEIKAAVAARGKASFTRTALFNSLAMGLTGDEAVGVTCAVGKGEHDLWSPE